MQIEFPLHISPLDASSANAILHWQYSPPYEIYNHDPAEAESVLATYLNLQNQYFALHDQSITLIGFCCFGAEARVKGGDYSLDALDVGMGLQPELTGRGFGGNVLSAVLEFADQEFTPDKFRVTVAEFNARAIQLYLSAGFKSVESFQRPADGMPFLVFVRAADTRYASER